MKNKTVEVIKSRHSVRKYIKKEVPEEILKELVDCARLAPTGYNKQAWVFGVITDQKLKEQIAYHASYGKFIKDAGACIAVFCDENSGGTPLEDACAATENIIIAAQSYGLGTCWVNSYKKEHSTKIMELLKSPDNMELMTLLAVGYYKEDVVKNKEKKSLKDVLKWNGWV